MKVTDIKVRAVKPIGPFTIAAGLTPKYMQYTLVTVETDEGIAGNFMSCLSSPDVFFAALPKLKALAVGKDPHFVEAITRTATRNFLSADDPTSALDICLWDILGKYHNVPVYKLLGAQKETMPCYTSTLCLPTPEAYAEEAREIRASGIRGFKLHGAGGAELDIACCRAVREAVPDMQLMIDPVNAYDRQEALKVGRVLEELNFEWYESPIPDDDIEGFRYLKSKLDIPMAGGEMHLGAMRDITNYLNAAPVDIYRTLGDRYGGISAMQKMAVICDAYQVRFHPHSYGSVSVQAANFHVMLANRNCKWLELPLPLVDWNRYMKDVVEIDQDGYAHAPQKAGLGYDFDWDMIENNTLKLS